MESWSGVIGGWDLLTGASLVLPVFGVAILARLSRFSSVPASGKASVVRVQVAQEVVDLLVAGCALRCVIRACPLPAIKRLFCWHIMPWTTCGKFGIIAHNCSGKYARGGRG